MALADPCYCSGSCNCLIVHDSWFDSPLKLLRQSQAEDKREDEEKNKAQGRCSWH